MPVTYLELENFKSYAGLQRIGPFHDFTCVVGPNGGEQAYWVYTVVIMSVTCSCDTTGEVIWC